MQSISVLQSIKQLTRLEPSPLQCICFIAEINDWWHLELQQDKSTTPSAQHSYVASDPKNYIEKFSWAREMFMNVLKKLPKKKNIPPI